MAKPLLHKSRSWMTFGNLHTHLLLASSTSTPKASY
jgi:hypothetical protein